MKKTKIMFIIHGVGYGGAGKMLITLANQLSRTKYDVILYTFANNKSHYPLEDNVLHITENNSRKNIVSKYIFPIFNIHKQIKKQKPDVVISFLSDANMFSVIGSSFTKVPVIVCERGDPYNDNSRFSKVMQWFFNYASGAVFQTIGASEYFSKKLQAKSIVIPNPVILNNVKILPDQRKNEIAFVARFDLIQKRQDIMVLAFKKVLDRIPNIKLVFYGDGPDLELVKEMVRNEGISRSVIFAGKINDVKEKISKSRLFVLTSDYEGIPNALIEAMSLGIPVVSTDTSPGGARLLIENKKNGLLVPIRDIDKIAEAIIFLLDNPQIAEEMGKEARNIALKFPPEKILDMWSNYIDQIVSNNRLT